MIKNIIILIGIIVCQTNPKIEGKKMVFYLNKDNLDVIINVDKSRSLLIYFMRKNDCSKCQESLEDFYSITYNNSISNLNIKSGIADCSSDAYLCELFSIYKYPTLVLVKDGYYYMNKEDNNFESFEFFVNAGYANEMSYKLRKTLPTSFAKFVILLKRLLEDYRYLKKSNNKKLIYIANFTIIAFLIITIVSLYKFIKLVILLLGNKKEKVD